jgi:hypothetical protein
VGNCVGKKRAAEKTRNEMPPVHASSPLQTISLDL